MGKLTIIVNWTDIRDAFMGVLQGPSLDFVDGRSRQLFVEGLVHQLLLLLQAQVPLLWILDQLPEELDLLPAHLAEHHLLLRSVQGF